MSVGDLSNGHLYELKLPFKLTVMGIKRAAVSPLTKCFPLVALTTHSGNSSTVYVVQQVLCCVLRRIAVAPMVIPLVDSQVKNVLPFNFTIMLAGTLA